MPHSQDRQEAEVAQDDSTPAGDQTIITAQLRQLELRPVLPPEQQGQGLDSRTELFLSWHESAPAAPAHSLGLYAKWLVLVDLLSRWRKHGNDDLKKLLGSRRVELLSKLFDPTSQKRLSRPERYDPTILNRPREERALDFVLLAILKTFNEELKARDRPQLQIDAFVRFEAALQPGADTVGRQPLRRLRHWLIYRTTLPNPPLFHRTWGEEHPVQHRAQSLLAGLRYQESRDEAHRVVLQLVDPATRKGDPEIAEALYAACQHDPDTEAFLPIVVSLDANATRGRVIKSLYKALLPGETAPNLDEREINLADDLHPLRQVLTVCRLLLIFDRCDSLPGPFSSLHDFLCDTMWSELIRCLAQPVQTELLQERHPPWMQSRIVVITNAPLSGIEPWLVPVETSAAASATTLHKPLIAARTLWALRTRVQAKGGFGDLPADGPKDSLWSAETAAEDIKMLAMYEPVILRLIVASVNGMQRPTLQRCLKSWVLLCGWTPGWEQRGTKESLSPRRTRIENALAAIDNAERFGRLVDRLKLVHSALLEEVRGEQTPWLTAQARETGLDRRPVAPRALSEEESDPLTIQVRSRAAAAAAVGAWRGSQVPTGSASGAGPTDIAGWEQISFVLCGESLRQATAQMRGLGHCTPEGVHWYRRFIQVVYHGLCCTGFEAQPALQASALASSLSFGGLPTEPSRRYRYLYSFVYRQCIEGGDWRLGRSFGRSDLRLALLTLFVRPSQAHRVVSGGEPMQVLPPPYCPELPPIPVSDTELRCDLLEALGRAGLDVGSPLGREATEWVMSVLPGWRLGLAPAAVGTTPQQSERYDINERLPQRGIAYQRVADSALKLRLDWLQSSGNEDHLSAVSALAREQLHRLGTNPQALDELHTGIETVLNLVRKNSEGVTEALFNSLEEALRALLRHKSSTADLKQISDVLFRLAEARATEADNQDFKALSAQDEAVHAAWVSTTQLFAESCAIYWLADRVRAAAGSSPDAGISWPMAGARTTRYFVRVALKTCRLVLDGKDGPPGKRAKDLAFELLDLAQDRLGLFTRHHFRFERERDSAMLLESARIRTWVRVEIEQAFFMHRSAFIDNHVRMAVFREQLEELKPRLTRTGMTLKRTKELEKQHGKEAASTRLNEQKQFDSVIEAIKLREGSLNKCNAELAVSRERYKACVQEQARVLAYAADLTERAEKALMSLGFQPNHVRRLYLERAKHAGTLSRLFMLPLRGNTENDS